jgi:hypothetical protein
MSLLTIAQTVLRETGKWQVPSTIVGNNDPTAVQMLVLANRTGRTIAQDHRWSSLLVDYTFNTAVSTVAYEVPDDFSRFASLTFWDNSNDTRVRGPVSAAQWQYLNSSGLGGASVFDKAFRIAGGQFSIYPTPTAIEVIAYQYWTRNWVTGDKAAFDDDDDTTLIDEDLIILGVKWRWLQAKGDAFENEKLEFMQRLDSLKGADGGRDMLRFGQQLLIGDEAGNLPESGYGL